jgi:hypothetical protein
MWAAVNFVLLLVWSIPVTFIAVHFARKLKWKHDEYESLVTTFRRNEQELRARNYIIVKCPGCYRRLAAHLKGNETAKTGAA